ncbi:NAD(P)/FAD-dependent oxidoreductase [Actinocorallia sp. A-T 12471]|uniref:NAD(P)/FAD-dependent oxidoreductase n=1 Tax=Actinocorallia sp. A-T 12471 TaxID=3089813 RepID=UPI0029D1031F|nr:NAD(P)/FAD-dependent oxidoreductase [Actinocorallia sp. A-T 12471]MDX6741597.1 NAD(P)/FAD-dependent oxidoreductase [Actinocorallia sp. A-T 12471]
MDTEAEFDVIVMGGGPGGSATAGLLAKRGHRVLVLERERFPRYHIGESLITGTIPTLEELGVRERMDELGFNRKYGGTLLWGRNQGTWDFRFTESSDYEYSHQVRRADFDAMLLARARELGARVVEEASVKDVLMDGDRVTGVVYTLRGEGAEHTARCRTLVDATGQQHLLARRFDLIEWHEDLRNIAVWTYWADCKKYRGTRAGDTVTENRPNGWFWYIPLADGTVSVGYVTPIEEFRASGLSLEELYARELGEAVEVRALTEGATRAAAFRSIKDWSYTCRSFQGPGWALVGDAAAFIDPLLSTGVTLAMRGAQGLAESLDAVLRDPSTEAATMAAYERDYREFLGSLLEFVRFFYDRTRNKEDYWDKAQETIDPHRLRPRRIDFATMLSGLTAINDVFDGPTAPSADLAEPADLPKAADLPEGADLREPAGLAEPADLPEPVDLPKAADLPKGADLAEPAEPTEPAGLGGPVDLREPAEFPEPAGL